MIMDELVEQARNLSKHQNMPLSISHYLRNMSKLANQWTTENYRDPDRQRIYLKDIDCPDLWRQKLEEQIPAGIFYMNESTGDIGGSGADGVYEKSIARAGDLMSSLPSEMRADNLMCYIGHEGTYTPAHREMCASLGQNLMVEASGTIDNEGKPQKSGSSIWFMTESKDRHLVSEYWLSTLGHDIEIEKHFAQINAWKAAPFKTYIVEQKVGDFILIPPLAPHQVWNRGTRTMKVAWNRTTVETLELALHEALPRARMVCRDEQYKNKAIIYFTLEKYSNLLGQIELRTSLAHNPQALKELKHGTKIRQLRKDFRRLFNLYTQILLSELLAPVPAHEKRGQYIPYEGFITCSYCRCNIFNRFLTCTACATPLPDGEEDTYDICMDCFAMGRSCSCISGYKWVEQFPWQDLVQKHETWRRQIISVDGGTTANPLASFQAERKKLTKKTLAQVCQEQLRVRPWSDPKNPRVTPSAFSSKNDTPANDDSDREEEQSNRKKIVSRRDRLDKNFVIEHVSIHPRERWKTAACSKCDRAYGYGSLWRMFDMMPITIMEHFNWECPFCLKICSCGTCRKRTGIVPYEPKGTVLGHDTKKVADPRSVEHLVDFSHSNITWIKNANDDHPNETRRLNRRIEEAEKARADDPALDDNYVDEGENEAQADDSVAQSNSDPGFAIDPMLSHILPQIPNKHATDKTGVSLNGPVNGLHAISPHQTNTAARPTDKQLNKNVVGSSKPPNANENIVGETKDRNFVSNGITYEYPDPEDSLPVNAPSNSLQALPHAQPATDRGKRKSSGFILQSDVVSGPQDDSNEQFRQAQRQSALQEAKANNRYIVAEAALTGKVHMITFKISASKLASLKQDGSTASKLNQEALLHRNELLLSDLPTVTSLSQSNEVSKKRKAKAGDDDTEFTIGKRNRPSLDAVPLSRTRENYTNYAEKENESDLDQIEQSPDQVSAISKSKGPRPLPKYLAHRSHGQDLPEDLEPLPPRQRKSLGGKPSQQPRPETSSSPKLPTRIPSSKTIPQAKLLVARSDPPPSTETTPNGRKRGRPTRAEALSIAQKLAEENRKAKLKAASWADSGEDDTESSDRSSSSSDEDTDRGATRNGKTMAVPSSIFSRPGLAGRKIKIVSAKSADAAER